MVRSGCGMARRTKIRYFFLPPMFGKPGRIVAVVVAMISVKPNGKEASASSSLHKGQDRNNPEEKASA
jgi:hypothetical protein